MYQRFGPVVRQWRALQLLMRNGVALPSQARDLGLTVPCPACPAPGINLPEDWMFDPDRRVLDLDPPSNY